LIKNEKTLYYIEKTFIDKPYKYAIYFECDDFVLNDKIKNYINIEDLKSENTIEIDNYMKPRYFEDDNIIVFAFYKIINLFISSIDSTKNIIYTTL